MGLISLAAGWTWPPPVLHALGPHDCRITTRYDEHFFNEAFFGILHEAGHGIYDQGLRADQYGLPLGEAVSLGIHESQSRLWENFVGRSLAFWQFFYPEAKRRFRNLGGTWGSASSTSRSTTSPLADPHGSRRGHLQSAHPGPLRAGASPLGDDLPPICRGPGMICMQQLGVVPPDAAGVLQDIHWSTA